MAISGSERRDASEEYSRKLRAIRYRLHDFISGSPRSGRGVNLPPLPRQKMLLFLKKILRTAMVIVQGIIIGLGLNYSWHYFLAEYLGWGDSAPDWYFQVQGMIFMAFFFLGLIGWALFYPRLDGYLTRKKI